MDWMEISHQAVESAVRAVRRRQRHGRRAGRTSVEPLAPRYLLSVSPVVYAPNTAYSIGAAPASAVAFLAGGVEDAAAVETGENAVSVSIGNGHGGLNSPTTCAVGQAPVWIAEGDFNNDGITDLVTANSGDDTVSVLLGNGHGGFSPAVSYAVGNSPNFVAVGDFSGNGHLDIATADNAMGESNGAVLSVLMNAGDGTFGPAWNSAVTGQAWPDASSLAVGDFNNDGKLDIAIGNPDANYVLIALGNGDGTFTCGGEDTLAYGDAASVAAADMNGDGNVDLVVGLAQGDAPYVDVLRGSGTGTFGFDRFYPTGGENGSFVTSADVNGDGKPDVLATSIDYIPIAGRDGAGGVSVLLNDGSGGLETAQVYNTGAGPVSAVAADFNGDGVPDILTADSAGNDLSVALGVGGGKFATAVDYSMIAPSTFYDQGVPQSVSAFGEFTGGDTPDLIVASNFNVPIVSVLVGNGDGTFQPPVQTTVEADVRQVVIGDFDGHGMSDAATVDASGWISVLSDFNAASGFQTQSNYATGYVCTSLVAVDLTGDGLDDIVAACFNEPYVEVFLNNGDGTFMAPMFVPDAGPTEALAVGDFNGDGRPDVATRSGEGAQNLGVMLNNGMSGGVWQGFAAPIVITNGSGAPYAGIAVADVNRDGKQDVIATGGGANVVTVFLGNGDGTFQAGQVVGSLPTAPSDSVVVTDLNADSFPDVVVGDAGADAVSVLLNSGNGSSGWLGMGTPLVVAAGSNVDAVSVADLNADGLPDIVTANEDGQNVTVLLQGDPPIVTVSGPGAAAAGSTVTFTASGFTTTGGTLSYQWDLDYDGSDFVPTVTGPTAMFTAEFGGPTTTIAVRATDLYGASTINTAVLEALPATPVLTGSYNRTTGMFDLSLPADPAIAAYTIQRQTSSGGWVTIDAGTASGTGPITYSDTLPSASDTYDIIVTNAFGRSETSASLTLTAVAPDAPTGLTVSYPAGLPYEFDVTWSHDLTLDTGYTVIATPAVTGVAMRAFDVPAGTLTCAVTGLTHDMPYTLSVTAVDTFADGSALPSYPATASATPGDPAGPAIPITSATTVSSTEVDVAWNVPGGSTFDGFEIAAADETTGFTLPLVGGPPYRVVAAAAGNETSVLVTGLKPNSQYSFVVFGYDPTGSTYGGNSATATTVGQLGLALGIPTGTPEGPFYVPVTASSGLAGAQYTVEATYASQPAYTSNNATGLFDDVPIGFSSVTVDAAVLNAPLGAFDSVTYYNYAPTIVVTGTPGSDDFYVSNSSSGLYTVTGSVTPIPAFYAPDGINLDVYGRGGTDTLTVASNASVTMTNDYTADGTVLNIDGVVDSPITHFLPGNNPMPAGVPYPTVATFGLLPLPSGGDSFYPSFSIHASATAEINSVTPTAQPGDVITATVGNFVNVSSGTTSATTFWVYGQTTSGGGDWEQATMLANASAGSNEAVSLQLPSSLPADSLYLLYEANGNASAPSYSYPAFINQPQIWWTNTNNAYQGGSASIFGTNLSLADSPVPYTDRSWVNLVNTSTGNETVIPVTAVAQTNVVTDNAVDVNPYKVDFDIPDTLPAGSYEVEVYNGHGGEFGISNAVPITIADAPQPYSVGLQYAYNAAQGFPSDPLSIYSAPGMIVPGAVNAAMQWATGYASNHTASCSYVSIQLPAGLIQLGTLTDSLRPWPFVHLVGAGDTGNSSTGTVIEGMPPTAGPGLEGLISLNHNDGLSGPLKIEISDMSLIANDSLEPGYGVIDNTSNFQLQGAVLERVTVDSTTEDPADPIFPNEAGIAGDKCPDVVFSGNSSGLQFLDSTFIGGGITIGNSSGPAGPDEFDNCHFIGCGDAGEQILIQYGGQYSVTRCTDQGLVDNITTPGGNVDLDAACRLVALEQTSGSAYFGDNTTTDLYCIQEVFSGINGGEQILLEASSSISRVTVYQNTLSGDGAMSFLTNGSGTTLAGDDVCVVDNNISNELKGIVYGTYIEPPLPCAFAMITGNSIYNVDVGIDEFATSVSDPPGPWFMCCSTNGNLISGVRNNPDPNVVTGEGWVPFPAAIDIESDSGGAIPDQMLMNVFNENVVTGAQIALALTSANYGYPASIADTILAGNFFVSGGGVGSEPLFIPEGTYAGTTAYVLDELDENSWQNFWS